MFGVEFARFTIKTKDDLGSALKIWGTYIPDSEPSFVETDEDGDTFARGQVESYWIEILREPHHVTFSFTADEKVRQYGPMTVLSDYDEVIDSGIRLCDRVCRDIFYAGMQIEVAETYVFASPAETMQRLREYLPSVQFPAGAQDGFYRVSVRTPLDKQPELQMRVHGTWRNGRRTYTEQDDEGKKLYLDAASLTLVAGLERSRDTEIMLEPNEVLHLLTAKIASVRSEGLDAL